MDHQEQKAQHKQHQRKDAHRHEKATESRREQAVASGPRRIHPGWLGAIGFVLAMVALLRWMGFF
jgi:hypothetical protein